MNQITVADRYLSGELLYGDDLDERGILEWYRQEEQGYFELFQSYADRSYAYTALNEYQVFRRLRGRRFDVCVALGCARGDDVAPLAPQVGRFIAIEPAEKWWRDAIGGVPADYTKPAVNGAIPAGDAQADLVVSFEVLHHVPNASFVFGELARVLKPGGTLVVREPVCTMGDWSRPRRGLTANERGFPPGWLEARARQNGLIVERRAYCSHPLIPRLARLLAIRHGYNSPALVRLDALLSGLSRWNLHYHRDRLWKKFAPIDVCLLLRKPPQA